MPQTRPRLLVIGAGGFVGSQITRTAAEACDVVAGLRRAAGEASKSVSIDITQSDSVRAAFDAVRPDAVILTAAMADIDRCEQEQVLAEQVNYFGPLHVARECQRLGARLLFTSTDAVFDGTLAAYPEDSQPTPVNFYGRTKARAEAVIQELLPTAVIVRFSLVLGLSPTPGNNSYVNKLADTLRAGREVRSPSYEFRNPIDVGTLAPLLVKLLRHDAAGIFHIGSSDKMSRYELARRLAVELGAPPELVRPQTEPIAGRAPRGTDDFLVCARLPHLIGFRVPTCDEVIKRAVHGTA
jgi:dTDP-4-dehydrorhamnose reductase